MSRLTHAAIAAVLVLALSGCERPPPEVTRSAGNGYQVARLFTVDGCSVYRFRDGSDRYFTNCSGSTGWTETCGKHCTTEQGVPGAMRPQGAPQPNP